MNFLQNILILYLFPRNQWKNSTSIKATDKKPTLSIYFPYFANCNFTFQLEEEKKHTKKTRVYLSYVGFGSRINLNKKERKRKKGGQNFNNIVKF